MDNFTLKLIKNKNKYFVFIRFVVVTRGQDTEN